MQKLFLLKNLSLDSPKNFIPNVNNGMLIEEIKKSPKHWNNLSPSSRSMFKDVYMWVKLNSCNLPLRISPNPSLQPFKNSTENSAFVAPEINLASRSASSYSTESIIQNNTHYEETTNYIKKESYILVDDENRQNREEENQASTVEYNNDVMPMMQNEKNTEESVKVN